MTAKLESDDQETNGPTPIRSLRMTEADWQLIKKEAGKRGFGSASEFIRATMLEKIRTKR